MALLSRHIINLKKVLKRIGNSQRRMNFEEKRKKRKKKKREKVRWLISGSI